jgi:hypothetical protein
MTRTISALGLFLFSLTLAGAAPPSLTIYNQNFAVVRGRLALDLSEGVSEVRCADITSRLEPSSVILRDPGGKNEFRIIEQSYRADAISQSMMLARLEGQTIDFLVQQPEKSDTIVRGRIVRSGREGDGGTEAPIVEVDGKLRFDLPGKPLFPKLADESILKPELNWKIAAPRPAKFDAELAYLSEGFNWSADYNVVVPESGGKLQITGLITINNQSGKEFAEAEIKLVAGDVNKIKAVQQTAAYAPQERAVTSAMEVGPEERSFADYHLYTLPQPVTLREREAKQVEFIRADGVEANRTYQYDATGYEDPGPIPYRHGPIVDPGWATDSSTRVGVIYQFKNSAANHLGIPLPAGRWRFYRQESGGQLQFTGENEQDHTAKDERLRIFTGTAFDLTAERRQTDFAIDRARRTMEEAFEVKLRNHKEEPVEIEVVEHLNRWQSWEMVDHSEPFTKKDAHTIAFVVGLKPEEEKAVRYRVRYTQLPTN